MLNSSFSPILISVVRGEQEVSVRRSVGSERKAVFDLTGAARHVALDSDLSLHVTLHQNPLQQKADGSDGFPVDRCGPTPAQLQN